MRQLSSRVAVAIITDVRKGLPAHQTSEVDERERVDHKEREGQTDRRQMDLCVWKCVWVG